ncbi:MAG: hypothetical protein ACI4JT_01865 [Oscillospiraceae bacterium]
MEILLLLMFIPAIVFVVMMIYVIGRAVRFGENRPALTNAASIVGIVAGLISIASSVVKLSYFGRGVGGFFSAAFCLAFAFALKFIVKFFEEDFDKKHQIPVNPDESLYRFEFKQDNPDNFFDENARFNGKFKDYDDDD